MNVENNHRFSDFRFVIFRTFNCLLRCVIISLFIVDWRNGGMIPVRVCKCVNRNASKIQSCSFVESYHCV